MPRQPIHAASVPSPSLFSTVRARDVCSLLHSNPRCHLLLRVSHLRPFRFAASHDTPISHQSTPATAYLVLDGLQIAIALLAVVIAIAKYRLLSRLKPNMALDRDKSIDIEPLPMLDPATVDRGRAEQRRRDNGPPPQHSTNLTTSAVAPPSPVTASCTAIIPVTHTTSTTSSTSSTCTSTTSISTSCTTPPPNPSQDGASESPCPKPVRTKDPKLPPSDPKNPPIRPCVTSQYDVWTGAVRRDEINGKIFKDGRKTDVTNAPHLHHPRPRARLAAFTSIPPLPLSGSGQFDVFVSLAPASHSADSWPSGNLRDQHIGRMVAHSDRVAEWLPGFPDLGQSFPCPAGQTYGGELVGVGDADHVEWLAGTSGPYITWS
ncbi:hypothetical protein Q7P37_002274 [Cladosporium fusiforme]